MNQCAVGSKTDDLGQLQRPASGPSASSTDAQTPLTSTERSPSRGARRPSTTPEAEVLGKMPAKKIAHFDFFAASDDIDNLRGEEDAREQLPADAVQVATDTVKRQALCEAFLVSRAEQYMHDCLRRKNLKGHKVNIQNLPAKYRAQAEASLKAEWPKWIVHGAIDLLNPEV